MTTTSLGKVSVAIVSSTLNQRPAAGCTSSTCSRLSVTPAARTRSGFSGSVKAALVSYQSARSSKVRFSKT